MINLLLQLNGWHNCVPLAGFAKKRDGCAERFEITIRPLAYSQTGRHQNVILTTAFGNQ
jgi:hypothetical protein